MKYFSIKELTRSETAEAKGIDNTPRIADVKQLTMLAEKVLDPLREAWGAPIHVNSGYRCLKLNAEVGGSKTSDHMFGRAADITAIHKDPRQRKIMNKQLFELCEALDLPYKQLIDEKNYTWLHISYDESSLKHQVLHL